ncbi:D-alanyl-D-alanine carboxypeptidase [Enterococcus sp. HSIEG1]|nr:D-alanyl-D-alanine carboxypeptidase [Enterococcus sp. HSIEG1]
MKKYLGILAAAGFLLISLVASLQQEHSASGETIASSQTVASSSEKEQARVSQKSKDFPKVSLDDWALVLVGPLNKGTEIDTGGLAKLTNGYLVDKRIVSDYEKLKAAAEKAGHPLVMISAFRSIASQKAVLIRMSRC